MLNEFESPDIGSTLTLPRPRDRASQTDFLRELSRSRRGLPTIVEPVSTVAPVAPLTAELDPTPASEPEISPTAVWPSSLNWADDRAPAAPSDVDETTWPTLAAAPALSAANWFDAGAADAAGEESEAPMLGLFDILPATTWPDLVAPDTAVEGEVPPVATWPDLVAPDTAVAVDAETVLAADAIAAEEASARPTFSAFFENMADPVTDTAAATVAAAPAFAGSWETTSVPSEGLFDILPATTWPDLVAPATTPIESPDIDGLLTADPWGAPNLFVEPIEPTGPADEDELDASAFLPAPPRVDATPERSDDDTPDDVDRADATSPSPNDRALPSTFVPAPAASATKPAPLHNRPPTITASSPVVVRCTGLVASRIARGKRHTVLDGADLTVHSGEVAVITGRSGSGKTTLIECLNGLHRIDAGTVLLGETSVGDATDAEIAELRSASIGYVAQEPHLLADLSAIENIELPLLLSGWDPAEARTEADAAVSLVRLERPNYRTSELSSGERRRVAIARALVGEPSILWCDEMSAAIDPETMAEIYELIFELCHDGLTVVAVTHDPVMLANASTIYELRDGTLHLVES